MKFQKEEVAKISNFTVFCLLFRRRMKEIVSFPFRVIFIALFWKRYKKEYERLLQVYSVGDIVRCIESENNGIVLMLSPNVQQSFSKYHLGKEGDEGYIELLNRKSSRGSVCHSFFDAREPWVIEKTKIDILFLKWVNYRLLGVDCSPIAFVLRPYYQDSIVWHEDYGYGRDRIRMDSRLLERFPEDEFAKFN